MDPKEGEPGKGEGRYPVGKAWRRYLGLMDDDLGWNRSMINVYPPIYDYFGGENSVVNYMIKILCYKLLL